MNTKALSFIALSVLFLSFTSPRKEKRAILKKVNQYVEQTVRNTSYTLDKAQLILLLDYYFLSHGYSCTGLSPTNVRYTKTIQYERWGEVTERIQTCEQVISYNDRERKTETEKIISYKTQSKEIRNLYNEQVSVVIDMFSLGETYRILTKKIRGNYVANPFSENELRRFLYSQCFGNNLTLPKKLSQEIETYNDTQTKERKKISFHP